METLCRVINGASELAEAGRWRSSYERTPVSDMSAAVRGEHVAAAHFDGRLVGSICTGERDSDTGYLGAFAVESA